MGSTASTMRVGSSLSGRIDRGVPAARSIRAAHVPGGGPYERLTVRGCRCRCECGCGRGDEAACRQLARRKYDIGAAEQGEDGRTAHQIALCHAPWRLCQAEGPFHSAVLNPFRRAALAAGQEVDRRADAQCETARTATRLQQPGNRLLLRRAHRQQAEAKRAVRLDEAQAGLDFVRLVNNPMGGLK